MQSPADLPGCVALAELGLQQHLLPNSRDASGRDQDGMVFAVDLEASASPRSTSRLLTAKGAWGIVGAGICGSADQVRLAARGSRRGAVFRGQLPRRRGSAGRGRGTSQRSGGRRSHPCARGVFDTNTGEIICALTINPNRDYQPQTVTKTRTPRCRFGPCRCLATSQWRRAWDSNPR